MLVPPASALTAGFQPFTSLATDLLVTTPLLWGLQLPWLHVLFSPSSPQPPISTRTAYPPTPPRGLRTERDEHPPDLREPQAGPPMPPQTWVPSVQEVSDQVTWGPLTL